jgi:DNA helicase-2/ATP-dependent DNA helicase PcrA
MNEIVEKSFAYLNELNDVQREAVECISGPVMVIAGPGSGKTRVLTYRIAHLINSGVAPWQILSLTFTNKAAREMKERIERVIGQRANKIWAGTFHSLFARILRVEAHRIDYPNDFTIYDTDDTKSVIKEILKTMSLDTKVYNPGTIRSRISSAKSNLITPKAYALDEELLQTDKMNRMPLLHQIYEKYVLKCMRAGAMDFDDLLLQMFKLLYQNPDNVKEKYQRQFKHVLVDEFQDTNFLQYAILKQFMDYEGSEKNICIVGDDAQSIYSFRGATIENILQFENDFPDVQTFKLEQNYRSQHHIVEAANGIITYNKRQIDKKIWTDRTGDNKIKIIKTISDSEEGKRVADLIIEQKNRFGLENKEISILYRTNAQSRVFEENLRRYNIPYRIYGGMSFYQRKEIKDVMAYMRLVVNPRDDEAFKRIINFPKRGIGNTTISKMLQLAEDNQMSLWECLPHVQVTKRTESLLAGFAKIIAECQVKAKQSNAYETAHFIVKKSGIMTAMKADRSMEGMGRLENINALLDGIQEFVEDDELEDDELEDDELEDDNLENDKSLARYLQNIALITDADEDKGDNNVVTLMSVHAAKGLEFKSVFVVGLEENLFPSFMSLSDPNQIDEERRLFYVAITRAEEYLTLTHSNSRYQYGQMRFNDPSRFLEEIPPENVDSIIPIKKETDSPFGTPKILGNFKPLRRAPMPTVNASDFVADDPKNIKEGMKVMHLKFGEGKVLKIDERQVATIHFEEIYDSPEKRIMLQYAKLQILD